MVEQSGRGRNADLLIGEPFRGVVREFLSLNLFIPRSLHAARNSTHVHKHSPHATHRAYLQTASMGNVSYEAEKQLPAVLTSVQGAKAASKRDRNAKDVKPAKSQLKAVSPAPALYLFSSARSKSLFSQDGMLTKPATEHAGHGRAVQHLQGDLPQDRPRADAHRARDEQAQQDDHGVLPNFRYCIDGF